MNPTPFSYQPRCSFSGGDLPATHKVAAPWSYGSMRELKTFALCREDHLEAALARAREAAAALSLAEGETLGPVAVYRLTPGARDAELTPLS